MPRLLVSGGLKAQLHVIIYIFCYPRLGGTDQSSGCNLGITFQDYHQYMYAVVVWAPRTKYITGCSIVILRECLTDGGGGSIGPEIHVHVHVTIAAGVPETDIIPGIPDSGYLGI